MRTIFKQEVTVPERPARPSQEAQVLEVEDGGAALVLTISDENDVGMFVRVQSWDPSGRHDEMRKLFGKRVRVRVEIL